MYTAAFDRRSSPRSGDSERGQGFLCVAVFYSSPTIRCSGGSNSASVASGNLSVTHLCRLQTSRIPDRWCALDCPIDGNSCPPNNATTFAGRLFHNVMPPPAQYHRLATRPSTTETTPSWRSLVDLRMASTSSDGCRVLGRASWGERPGPRTFNLPRNPTDVVPASTSKRRILHRKLLASSQDDGVVHLAADPTKLIEQYRDTTRVPSRSRPALMRQEQQARTQTMWGQNIYHRLPLRPSWVCTEVLPAA